jgi:hypothetical protein
MILTDAEVTKIMTYLKKKYIDVTFAMMESNELSCSIFLGVERPIIITVSGISKNVCQFMNTSCRHLETLNLE